MKKFLVAVVVLAAMVLGLSTQAVAQTYLYTYTEKGLRKGGMDSTAVFQTQGWRHMALWLKARCSGGGSSGNCDSVVFAAFAIQVRAHRWTDQDSLSSKPRAFWKRGVAPPQGMAPDTIGSFVSYQRDSLANLADPTSEIVYIANVSAEKKPHPLGSYIELTDACTGGLWLAERTSIRVRLLDVYNANGVVFRSASPDNLTFITFEVEGWR